MSVLSISQGNNGIKWIHKAESVFSWDTLAYRNDIDDTSGKKMVGILLEWMLRFLNVIYSLEGKEMTNSSSQGEEKPLIAYDL